MSHYFTFRIRINITNKKNSQVIIITKLHSSESHVILFAYEIYHFSEGRYRFAEYFLGK